MGYAVVTECNDMGNHTSSIGTTDSIKDAKKFVSMQYNSYVKLLKENNIPVVTNAINIDCTNAILEFLRDKSVSWVRISLVDSIDISNCV